MNTYVHTAAVESASRYLFDLDKGSIGRTWESATALEKVCYGEASLPFVNTVLEATDTAIRNDLALELNVNGFTEAANLVLGTIVDRKSPDE